MGRLIGEDELVEEIKSLKIVLDGKDIFPTTAKDTVLRIISEQPTAYDPDKVVEQLEDYGNEETHYYKNTPYEKCIEECIGKAIQIVKGGGVDGN